MKEANGINPSMKKMADEDGDFKAGCAMDWNVAPGGRAVRSLALPPRAHAAAVTHIEELDRAAVVAGSEADNASPGNTPPQTPERVAGPASFAA